METEIRVSVEWDGVGESIETWKFAALWFDDEDETGPTLWLEDGALSVQISWADLTAALESQGYTVPPLDRAQQGFLASQNS